MGQDLEGLADANLLELRAVRDRNAFAALGRAVSYLMTKPNFSERQFGNWSRTLTGQVNRGHYFLVTDGKKIVGFAGWALVDEERGRLWLNGCGDLASKDCINGDCMVINAWAADNSTINRLILKELRKYAAGRRAVYAKRFYSDGSVRPLQLAITKVLNSHLDNTP